MLQKRLASTLQPGRAGRVGEHMIRFRLKELIAEQEFQAGRRVTLDEIAKATDIHRSTLSKIANIRGYNTTTENLDRLCEFFGCRLEDMAVYVTKAGGVKKKKAVRE